jgi:hypothetical protein
VGDGSGDVLTYLYAMEAQVHWILAYSLVIMCYAGRPKNCGISVVLWAMLQFRENTSGLPANRPLPTEVPFAHSTTWCKAEELRTK